MEKITGEILQLIEELHMLDYGREGQDKGKDRYGFELEPQNCVSSSPLDFTERAMRLQVEAREAYRMTMMLNRHSPLFIRISGLLERLLNHLGSYCITKAVMEAQGGISAPAAEEPESVPEEAPQEEDVVPEEEVPEEIPESELMNLKIAEPDGVSEEKGIIDQIMETPEYLRPVPVEGRPLTEAEKKALAYFASIPGIDYQITSAIAA